MRYLISVIISIGNPPNVCIVLIGFGNFWVMFHCTLSACLSVYQCRKFERSEKKIGKKIEKKVNLIVIYLHTFHQNTLQQDKNTS